MRRRGKDLMLSGGLAVLIGVAAMGWGYRDHSICNSWLGQLGQAFDNKARVDCTVVNVVWGGGMVAAGTGVAVFIAGAANATTPPPRQSSGPRPGWYPDPWRQARWRWWNGASWTHHTSNQ